MKIRNGFVSNSSSSSFIVIGHKKYNVPDYTKRDYIIGEKGMLEFNWDIEDHFDFDSKVNFATIQALCMENDDYIEDIKDVIKKHTNCRSVFNEICLDGIERDYMGYIDHASSASEDKNIEMFKSKDKLERFLCCSDSLIHTDNDNY